MHIEKLSKELLSIWGRVWMSTWIRKKFASAVQRRIEDSPSSEFQLKARNMETNTWKISPIATETLKNTKAVKAP